MYINHISIVIGLGLLFIQVYVEFNEFPFQILL